MLSATLVQPCLCPEDPEGHLKHLGCV